MFTVYKSVTNFMTDCHNISNSSIVAGAHERDMLEADVRHQGHLNLRFVLCYQHVFQACDLEQVAPVEIMEGDMEKVRSLGHQDVPSHQ